MRKFIITIILCSILICSCSKPENTTNYSFLSEKKDDTISTEEKSVIQRNSKWVKEIEVDASGVETGRVIYSLKEQKGYFTNKASLNKGNLVWDWSIDNEGYSTFILRENGDNTDLSDSDNEFIITAYDGEWSTSSFGKIAQNGTVMNAVKLNSNSFDWRTSLAKATTYDVTIHGKDIDYDLGKVDTFGCEALFFDVDGYTNAVNFMKNGKYTEALEVFNSLDVNSFDYFECQAKVMECKEKIDPFDKKEMIKSAANIDYSNYTVGDLGPSGGYIFYDCDADNNAGDLDELKSVDCGWRFIEAAPEDININGNDSFVFGYFRARDDSKQSLYVTGTKDYVEGTASLDDGKSTGKKIGTGFSNTIKLVKAMGNYAYIDSDGPETTERYAAKLCYKFSLNGFDNWFLPSSEELRMMYQNLYLKGHGNFRANRWSEGYWSSSEFSYWGTPDAINIHFEDPEAKNYDNGRGSKYYVRAVRYF